MCKIRVQETGFHWRLLSYIYCLQQLLLVAWWCNGVCSAGSLCHSTNIYNVECIYSEHMYYYFIRHFFFGRGFCLIRICSWCECIPWKKYIQESIESFILIFSLFFFGIFLFMVFSSLFHGLLIMVLFLIWWEWKICFF